LRGARAARRRGRTVSISPIWRNRRLSLIILVAALGLGLAFSATGLGRRLDGFFFDSTAPLLGRPRPVEDLLVILISEADYSAAATPLALWSARLVPLLELIESGRPEAVGLDLVLPQFPLARLVKDHDQKVFKTLNRVSKSCRLVSGYGITTGGSIREPFVLYQRILGPDGYGYFNLTPDPDGVCRRQVLSLPSREGRTLYSFASLTAGVKRSPGASITPDWRNPALIPRLTFGQALAAQPGAFAGKIVLIGVDFEFEDRHPTPAPGRIEAGVLFQARVVEALKSGRELFEPGWALSLLGPAGLVGLLALILTRRASQSRVVASGAAMLGGLLVLLLGGLAAGLVLRPSTGLAGLVLITSARFGQGYFTVKETFGRYVARRVRDEILSGRIPLDGQLTEVTVLFSDLRNFTPLAEATPPKEVVRILNGYFKEMSEAIRDNNGLVLQYIGDEIMAVFGAPVPAPDHARSALSAALEMRRRLIVVNEELQRQGRQPLRHGIGVHTGTVVAANLGGGDRVSYSLIGDTVNLASRLQGLNKEFGTDVIISGQTLARVDREVPVKQLPPTPIKGKSKPVDIFSVL